MQSLRAALRPLTAPVWNRGIASSSSLWKASEPAYAETAHEHDDEVCAFKTTIGEILSLKEEDRGKLWCADHNLVIEAVRKMCKFNVGSLLVFDGNQVTCDSPTSAASCVGIITERDYLTKVVVHGKNSHCTKVSEIMTPAQKLRVLTPKHSVLEAMEVMVQNNVRHIPVMDSNAMLGILSMKDVMKVLLDDQKQEIDQLKDYIHGSY